ncbi:beta-ketoacyl-[acyl-carrier-protein] synthase family protein [Lipingzhangella sp. LS1_29]|uniref:Beta-ketoacyl-[acyl-carrier-protein] synthase family protein n=1 Tax=Lipingzhangella rawalii TaxID=2055835 RepID=A0ABU2H1R4_9ACTN|nr:beta-ketoacyl-[acyl-carrier-protein] synthase family protein [Lipingzhangella rawalii]MDS1269234.1 beta-ketoacyl-[acyl-carrier-protein] synthase family protein [Lipingzhangella rawalii]
MTAHHCETTAVVTGIGVISPAGSQLDEFAKTVWSATPTADAVTRCNTEGLSTRIACEVREFDPTSYMSPKTARRLDPYAQFGLAAALTAVDDAGGSAAWADVPQQRRAIVCGTGVGGYNVACEQALVCDRNGPDRVSPLLIPMLMPNAANAAIAMELGWRGPSLALATACASGSSAVGQAARLIRDGRCTVALAGGADNGVTRISLAAFAQLGALSQRNQEPQFASRPFDRNRDGYVMGEGSAFLVLESLDHARNRGARAYAQVCGYAENNDAHHLTAPRPDGQPAAACMRSALDDAGLTADQIGHINAHGTSTAANDAMEARALATVFGSWEKIPPITAPKGVFGHLMGGAGAIEAAVAALSVHEGSVPPVANHSQGDVELDGELDVVVGVPRRVGHRPVLSSSFGLGGQNASLVLGPVPNSRECVNQKSP